MASYTVAHAELEQIQRIGGADLVIGILAPEKDDVSGFPGAVQEALSTLKTGVRSVVLCKGRTTKATLSDPAPPQIGGVRQWPFLTLPSQKRRTRPSKTCSNPTRPS